MIIKILKFRRFFQLLKLKGYSGFELSIKQTSKGFYFKKHTNTNTGRLLQQSKKQQLYKKKLLKNPLHHIFDIPEIVNVEQNDFLMEYVHGCSILDLIEYEQIDILKSLVDYLFDLIEWETSLCKNRKVPVYRFMDKLCKIPDVSNFKNILKKKLVENNKSMIPIGFCHGDLTLSNIIYSKKIYLVDLHDPFIESPLQDICKLFQEVDLKWSFLMSKKSVDKPKINIAYDFLCKRVYDKAELFCRKYSINREVLFLFHFMTLYRLFAYTKTKNMKNFVKKSCLRLLKDEEKFNSPYSWRE